MSHTPGPWKLAQYSSGAEIYGPVPLKDGARGDQILLLATVVSDRHGDLQGNANASLMTAAPALLAACEDAEDWLFLRHGEPPVDPEKVDEYHRTILRLRAAIAAAKGE